jgi:hypothetical protein
VRVGAVVNPSSWTTFLLIAGAVSVGGMVVRLTFIVGPAAVDCTITDIAGLCVFGATVVLLGFGVGGKLFGTG